MNKFKTVREEEEFLFSKTSTLRVFQVLNNQHLSILNE